LESSNNQRKCLKAHNINSRTVSKTIRMYISILSSLASNGYSTGFPQQSQETQTIISSSSSQPQGEAPQLALNKRRHKKWTTLLATSFPHLTQNYERLIKISMGHSILTTFHVSRSKVVQNLRNGGGGFDSRTHHLRVLCQAFMRVLGGTVLLHGRFVLSWFFDTRRTVSGLVVSTPWRWRV